MINLLTAKKLLILFVITLFISCSKGDSGEPEPTPPAVKISNLVYSPASFQVQAGTTGSSSAPSLTGTSPVTFNITTSPSSNGAITIDSEGKIKSSAALTTGTYIITVTATNSEGSSQFSNAYTITVTAVVGPQNLIYNPASITASQGTAVLSATPTITSASAVTYSITSSPSNAAISINNQGVISATNALTTGTYQISVTATDITGSKTFTNSYSIIITGGSGTSSVTYNNTVKAIIQNNCGSCHINGPQLSFGSYNSAKNNINNILSRINLAQGASGMMPSGGTKLSQSTIDLIQKWKDDGLVE